MHSGTISKIVLERGFGFIQTPGDPPLFFHCSNMVGLEFSEQLVGLQVNFDVEMRNARPQAVRVKAWEAAT